MKLGELLGPGRVIVPLEAATVREATTQLAQALVATGDVADEARLAALLRDEWPEDVVSVGGRALLPHFRTDAVRRVALALGVAPAPIARGGDAGRASRVVVLIVAPVREASAYLRAMSAVAHALARDEVLAGLHEAKTPEDVLALAGLQEAAVPAEVRVGDIMTAAVAAVRPDTKLGEAAGLLLQRGVRALPVVGGDGEVVGMLTDGHLLNYLLPATVSALSGGPLKARRGPGKAAASADAADLPVREVMDRSVLCLAEDQSVADVAALMLAKDVDRFPVTRDGALVGFLPRGDIVRKLLGA